VVVGTGLKPEWLRKALQRKGYKLLKDEVRVGDILKISLNKDNDAFELQSGKLKETFDSIEDVIGFIDGVI
jgi:phosphoribosylformylglycinamidine (FGAM) synthase PurS component